MNRFDIKLASLVLAAAALVGCQSNAYHPPASDTELASYAGKSGYPDKVQAVLAPHLFAVVSPDATITIYNAGDESYSDFEIWVNKVYTLHIVSKGLDSRSMISIAPGTLYNNTGVNMGGGAVPATGITTVQIYNKDQLMTVQGPILPH